VTALGPPALLERMSAALCELCPPDDRGAVSARLEAALGSHLEPDEARALAALVRRMDALAAAVEAKVRRIGIW
jgi:hypothetical protein